MIVGWLNLSKSGINFFTVKGLVTFSTEFSQLITVGLENTDPHELNGANDDKNASPKQQKPLDHETRAVFLDLTIWVKCLILLACFLDKFIIYRIGNNRAEHYEQEASELDPLPNVVDVSDGVVISPYCKGDDGTGLHESPKNANPVEFGKLTQKSET